MQENEKVKLLGGDGMWKTYAGEGIRALKFSDGPCGLRCIVGRNDWGDLDSTAAATAYPVISMAASSWDLALLRLFGCALAAECIDLGVDVLLAPGVNIKRTPLCGRNFEYFSEDPILAGELVAAYINGVQEAGVAATLKHFALNNQEYARLGVSVFVDERTLREIYLRPFEIAIKKSNPWAMMSSYNRYEGIYCSENPKLLTQILREEWGYDGLVMSDWGAVSDRVAALQAGLDLQMPECKPDTKRLAVARKSGELQDSTIEKSIGRLKLLAERTALKTKPPEILDYHKIAKKIADESAVLMQNKDGVLPLGEKPVLIVGELAEKPHHIGGGSAFVKTQKSVHFLEAMRRNNRAFTYARGYDQKKNVSLKKLEEDALQKAEQFDTILFFAGLNLQHDRESFDRYDLRLPANQLRLLEKLITLQKKIIVVLSAGSAVELPFADSVSAILNIFMAGEAVGESTYDLLFGKVNPSGRLAETFPIRYEDTWVSNFDARDPRVSAYQEGVFVGYRYFDMAKKDVRFPFGHGLSYSEFLWDDFSLKQSGSSLEIACSVQNISGTAGAEVIEVYSSIEKSALSRPPQELKAFQKVWLQPKEKKRVHLTIDTQDLAVFDTKSGRFVVEEGRYNLTFAKSSRLPVCSKHIDIEGMVLADMKVETYEQMTKTRSFDAAKSMSDFSALLSEDARKQMELIQNHNNIHLNTLSSEYHKGFSRLRIQFVKKRIRTNRMQEVPVRRWRYQAGFLPFEKEVLRAGNRKERRGDR